MAESAGLLIEVHGKVRLTDEEDGIRSISDKGYLIVKDMSDGREVLVEEEDGVLYYQYYQRGKKLDYEGEGEKWFKKVWKDVVPQINR
jgi:hypothetical protein